jgi:hypothetical protein
MSPTQTAQRTETLPHEVIWTVTTSMAPARALQLVGDLGVADHIDDGTVHVRELAVRCGVEADPLDRVLQLLVAHGIFARDAGEYAHTEASRLLRDDHPMSMRPFVRMFGLPLFWSSFAGLDRSLRTGSPALTSIEPDGFFAYLGAHPEEARVFDHAMTAKAGADVAAILDAYDFRPFRTIVDVGGGRGHLLHAVLDAVPTATGVLFDLPAVIDAVEVRSGRLTPHAGDFFVDPLPGADAYVLMEVLHDWADREALAILRAIRQAARAGAVVLLVEGIVPEDHADPRVHTLDLTMLAITGGRERTAADIGQLLLDSGFRATAVIETAGAMRILEAVAV